LLLQVPAVAYLIVGDYYTTYHETYQQGVLAARVVEKSSFFESNPLGSTIVFLVLAFPSVAALAFAFLFPRPLTRPAMWASAMFLLLGALLWLMSGTGLLYLPSALLLLLAAVLATPEGGRRRLGDAIRGSG